jgi:hypothetical protein
MAACFVVCDLHFGHSRDAAGGSMSEKIDYSAVHYRLREAAEMMLIAPHKEYEIWQRFYEDCGMDHLRKAIEILGYTLTPIAKADAPNIVDGIERDASYFDTQRNFRTQTGPAWTEDEIATTLAGLAQNTGAA